MSMDESFPNLSRLAQMRTEELHEFVLQFKLHDCHGPTKMKDVHNESKS